MQRSHPCISVRVDPALLAALAAFYESRDRAPRTLAELVRRGLTDLHQILQLNTLTHEQAAEHYERFHYGKLNAQAAAADYTTHQLAALAASAPLATSGTNDLNREKREEAMRKLAEKRGEHTR